MDRELVPGTQDLLFELEPVYAIRLSLRETGADVSRLDRIWSELNRVIHERLRPLDHDGTVTNLVVKEEVRLEVSAPGSYELSLPGLGQDRFLPIPAQRIEVRAGQTTDVIIELQRRWIGAEVRRSRIWQGN